MSDRLEKSLQGKKLHKRAVDVVLRTGKRHQADEETPPRHEIIANPPEDTEEQSAANVARMEKEIRAIHARRDELEQGARAAARVRARELNVHTNEVSEETREEKYARIGKNALGAAEEVRGMPDEYEAARDIERGSDAVYAAEMQRRMQEKKLAQSKVGRIRRKNEQGRELFGGTWELPEKSPSYLPPEGDTRRNAATTEYGEKSLRAETPDGYIDYNAGGPRFGRFLKRLPVKISAPLAARTQVFRWRGMTPERL